MEGEGVVGGQVPLNAPLYAGELDDGHLGGWDGSDVRELIFVSAQDVAKVLHVNVLIHTPVKFHAHVQVRIGKPKPVGGRAEELQVSVFVAGVRFDDVGEAPQNLIATPHLLLGGGHLGPHPLQVGGEGVGELLRDVADVLQGRQDILHAFVPQMALLLA